MVSVVRGLVFLVGKLTTALLLGVDMYMGGGGGCEGVGVDVRVKYVELNMGGYMCGEWIYIPYMCPYVCLCVCLWVPGGRVGRGPVYSTLRGSPERGWCPVDRPRSEVCF